MHSSAFWSDGRCKWYWLRFCRTMLICALTLVAASKTLGTLFGPYITEQPASQAVSVGDAVTFQVKMSVRGTYTYQWKFNQLELRGATNDTLTITHALSSSAGSYMVTVSYPNGTATSQPATLTVNPTDFGDAPDAPYPTTIKSDGARHSIVKGIFLGRYVDAETDGQASVDATGDDQATVAADDEDGVAFLSALVPGQNASVQVVASVSGKLDAWIDFNANGSWADTGDQIFFSATLLAGTNLLGFVVPSTAKPGATFSRFRFSTQGGLTYKGSAPDGEVEDYQVTISQALSFDFGDAPEPYPTLLAKNGAKHSGNSKFCLGRYIDSEPDGQPSADALGDDNNPTGTVGDEDGIRFLTALLPGRTVTLEVVTTMFPDPPTTVITGKLNAWIDFNQNGSWADSGEQIFVNLTVGPGTNLVSFQVPSDIKEGKTYARFRLNREGNLKFDGPAQDGEVEDYLVTLSLQQVDFGDAPQPYPTLLADKGAWHMIIPNFWLGARVDGERDGQPSADAKGDDLAPAGTPSDEDGVRFLTPLTPGSVVKVEVVATLPSSSTTQPTGKLNAWIDFNMNGSWADAGDQVFTNYIVGPGTNILAFRMPTNIKEGDTFARFRLNREGALDFSGPALDGGEVEDYQVPLGSRPWDFGDAPEPYPTTLKNNGARHLIVPRFYLGKTADAESDGQTSANALGDDSNPPNAVDDEDGVTFTTPIIAGQRATVEVVVTMSTDIHAFLNGWIDFYMDGSWAESLDHVIINAPVVNGTNVISFDVPVEIKEGATFARFRLNSTGQLSFDGPAEDGEVEDYQVELSRKQFDFGDAPDSYSTTLKNNGARHVIVPGFCLGSLEDPEEDGQPTEDALGDDKNPPGVASDEDGVRFLTPIVVGRVATVEVVVNMSPNGRAFLNGWIDFYCDGTWIQEVDHVIIDKLVVNGTNVISFNVPSEVKEGLSFARFRLNRTGKISFSGLADDGEVEDYQVTINRQLLDFGDAPAPYPTTLKNNGARHIITPEFQLGALVDAEADGQPDTTATGDDINPAGADDEDGVRLLNPLLPGGAVQVEVVATGRGYLDAWVDFNQNGSWADEGEKIFDSVLLGATTNNLTFKVPENAVNGITYARFRLSRKGQLNFDGPASDGEVEDYQVRIGNCETTSEGNDYWLTFPGNYAPDPTNTVQLKLCILGIRETAGTVSIPGLGFATNFTIVANLAIVTLPKEADLADAIDRVENKGIHVSASRPVEIFAVNHVKYTTDGYLALPVNTLGREYIVQAYGNEQTGVPDLNGTQFALVGCESNTLVTITLPVKTAGHAAGVPFQIKLDLGQTYQLRNTGDAPADLTGTIIQAERPIAVFAGHQCANIATKDAWFCDTLVEQLLPVRSWGVGFVSIPLATRSADTFRILASQDNTTVAINGIAVATLNRGRFHEQKVSMPAYITADHPVFVTQFSNSSDFDGVRKSDPFMMTVPPMQLFRPGYQVYSFTNDMDKHYLNVLAPEALVGSVAVDGVPIPAGDFSAVGGSGFAGAQVSVAGGRHIVTQMGGGGLNFGVMAYGFAEYDSYGYPGGMRFPDLSGPQVTGPTSLTVEANPDSCLGIVPEIPVEVTDNCAPVTRVKTSQNPSAGSRLQVGVYPVTITADDGQGNPGTFTTMLTITDPSPPSIVCPTNLTIKASNTSGTVVNFRVLARTRCGLELPVVCEPASGSFFPIGTTKVACIASNAWGIANCSFTVTVTGLQTTKPVLAAAISNQKLALTWEGNAVLESASSIMGPWTQVPTTSTSYTIPVKEPNASVRQFYRLRQD